MREVSGIAAYGFVLYVRRARGAAAAERVAAAAGLTVADVVPTAWFTADEARAIARAAAEECGDDDIGRRAGEALFWETVENGMSDFLVATGSPEGALALLTEWGGRTSSRQLVIVESGEDHVVIEGRVDMRPDGDRTFCSFPAAMYGLVPSLFGFVGTAAEVACQHRGSDRCRYEVRWQPDPRGAKADVDRSTARVVGMIDRYEQLRVMASELASVDDPSEALEEIVAQAPGATNAAPRYLLGVTIEDGEPLRLHHSGFADGADVASLAERVFAGEQGVDGHDALVVDIASGRRAYGKLAALFPAGRAFTEPDRRVFAAYAGHAAAALDALVALDTARRNRSRSDALLTLARALAVVSTSDQMAERLAEAMIPVVGCAASSVWLCQEGGFELAAVGGASGRPRGLFRRLDALDLEALAAESIAGPPVLLDVADAPETARLALGGTSITRIAMAPIVVRDEVLGVAAAGFEDVGSVVRDRDLVQRLAALTDQAATALDNARLLERVHHDALHDRLTGLPNRTLIEDRADMAMRRAERSGAWPSLLFVDLDRFKNVNDTLGHATGDELIRQVAIRLRTAVGDPDTLARLGGDEFVVLLEADGTRTDPAGAAQRLNDALREPFVVDDRDLYISCSIGIASAPNDGITYAHLMQHADVAMYEAKDLGRGTYAVYTPPRSGPRRERLDLETQLHRAVENRELAVLYQPQMDLRTDALVGVEALVRWDHPALGRLSPDQFLPLAEESGLIVDIDRWMRREAFAQGRRWLDGGLTLRIAVNLSTRDLQKRALADDIAGEVDAAGLAVEMIEVEVTDRVVLGDDTLPSLVHRLRGVGLRVAIDDFGTGTSVLGRLRSCHVDTLKIDRSFVQEIGTADGDTIARALVSLGASLDLDVVAEGIETEEQKRLLRTLGCPLGQGYLLGRPMTAADVTALAMPEPVPYP